jgi:hypothetical protein
VIGWGKGEEEAIVVAARPWRGGADGDADADADDADAAADCRRARQAATRCGRSRGDDAAAAIVAQRAITGID